MICGNYPYKVSKWQVCQVWYSAHVLIWIKTSWEIKNSSMETFQVRLKHHSFHLILFQKLSSATSPFGSWEFDLKGLLSEWLVCNNYNYLLAEKLRIYRGGKKEPGDEETANFGKSTKWIIFCWKINSIFATTEKLERNIQYQASKCSSTHFFVHNNIIILINEIWVALLTLMRLDNNLIDSNNSIC